MVKRALLRRAVLVPVIVLTTLGVLAYVIDATFIDAPVQATGYLEPVSHAQLNFVNPGPIVELDVRPGSWANAGQVIARQDSRVPAARLAADQAQLIADQALLLAASTSPLQPAQAQQLADAVAAAIDGVSSASTAEQDQAQIDATLVSRDESGLAGAYQELAADDEQLSSTTQVCAGGSGATTGAAAQAAPVGTTAGTASATTTTLPTVQPGHIYTATIGSSATTSTTATTTTTTTTPTTTAPPTTVKATTTTTVKPTTTTSTTPTTTPRSTTTIPVVTVPPTFPTTTTRPVATTSGGTGSGGTGGSGTTASVNCADIAHRVAADQAQIAVDQGNIQVDEATAASDLSKGQAGVRAAQDKVTQARDGAEVQALAQTPAALAVLRADAVKDTAAIAADQEALDDTVLRAPSSGYIGNVGGAVGDLATSGGIRQYLASDVLPQQPTGGIELFPQQPTGSTTQPDQYAPLASIDSVELQIVTQVSESDVQNVRLGQQARVRMPALPGRTLHARVERIEPEGVAVSGSIYYLVDLGLSMPVAEAQATSESYVDVVNATTHPNGYFVGLTADVNL